MEKDPVSVKYLFSPNNASFFAGRDCEDFM
jgi:hypothetical protein